MTATTVDPCRLHEEEKEKLFAHTWTILGGLGAIGVVLTMLCAYAVSAACNAGANMQRLSTVEAEVHAHSGDITVMKSDMAVVKDNVGWIRTHLEKKEPK